MFSKTSVRLTVLGAGLVLWAAVSLVGNRPVQAQAPIGSASADSAAMAVADLTAGSGAVADDWYPVYPCWNCPPGIIIIGHPYPYYCRYPYYPPGLPVPGTTPAPTPTLVPMPTPTPGGAATSVTYTVCPQIANVVPAELQALALAEPWRFYGYNQLRNPSVPYHPVWNTLRTHLALRDFALPYSRCNTVTWKASCP